MADARDAAPERAGAWLLPVTRGALAIVPSVVITFSQDHSAGFGLAVFGWWALVAGVVVGALSARLVADRTSRWVFVGNGVITAAAGLVALQLAGTPSSGVAVFTYTVAVWAALTGILELFVGVRGRGRVAAARDWLTVGGLTAVLALAFVLLPLDPVTAVGLLGAYLVVAGVLLVIGGLSLKWAATERTGSSDAASGSERS
ncbi:HdeD family acid-resistance protein [Agromyces sp. GXQ0307]|uniref:HdeD family acid-resistance protein n=1 Tax=Agromyces sp. GXQ0307 TaxID=3377835 RepID=UPI00383AFC83